MKKNLVVVWLACQASIIYAQTSKMKLSGEIENIEDGTITLSRYITRTEFDVIDSSQIVDGKFTFTRQLPDTAAYVFTLRPSGLKFGAILENGSISITGDASKEKYGYFQVNVVGSYNDSLLQVANAFRQNVLEQQKYTTYRKLIEQYEQQKDKDKKYEIKEQMEPYQDELSKEVTELQLNFIKSHLNTYVAASTMVWIHDAVSLDELKSLYNSFSDRWKNSDALAETKTEIEFKERVLPGKQAPNFTLLNPEGESISLSDYKGKVVLIDFWASWCRPCRNSFPHLKELYKKYKPMGFEIIGVSNDSNHEQWKKAIQEDGINWVHTVDEFPEKYKPARVATLYAIPYLPTTFLIDREGKIMGKFHGEELDKKLEALFKK